MARREDDKHEFEADLPDTRRAIVYLPCPTCGRAVKLSDETRVEHDPETYECANCGARFFLAEP